LYVDCRRERVSVIAISIAIKQEMRTPGYDIGDVSELQMQLDFPWAELNGAELLFVAMQN
jgi:hypothetical protein